MIAKLTLLAAMCSLTITAFSQTPDTIYHNGSIITIDDANPRVEAVAVKDGKILAAGKKDELLKSKGDATKLIDLGGKTMLPGFVDAHGHVFAGGIEFMRPWTEKVYGIPPEQVIGSSIKTKFELREGKPVILRLPELNFIDDKAGKPAAIQHHIGRRPIAAFGNSDGDLQMLQWTAAGTGPRFCLYVHHTDAAREWAYDRTSHIGKLDKGLDEAKAKGWTVVDMKTDWKRIFAFEK